jgi:hypothetical protein
LKSFKITTITSDDTTISDDDLFFTNGESHDMVNGRLSSDFFLDIQASSFATQSSQVLLGQKNRGTTRSFRRHGAP